ncbi:hypothetical protein M1203_36595 [Streptomyces sp. 35G-GA-8]|nr:hypothetical protein [Streptomyces sp. 35G-GA-8]
MSAFRFILWARKNGVRRLFDLRLLVAQSGDEGAVGGVLLVGPGELVQRGQRVAVAHPDLADPPAEAGLEHHDPHDLLVSRSAFLDRGAEQVEVGHDLGERGVVDDFPALRLDCGPALLPMAPEDGMVGVSRSQTGSSSTWAPASR